MKDKHTWSDMLLGLLALSALLAGTAGDGLSRFLTRMFEVLVIVPMFIFAVIAAAFKKE